MGDGALMTDVQTYDVIVIGGDPPESRSRPAVRKAV